MNERLIDETQTHFKANHCHASQARKVKYESVIQMIQRREKEIGPIEPTSRNLLTPHSLAGEHLRGARY